MKDVLIIAHRGVSSLYPENTLLSFVKAQELGVDMIETDVHQTKDKELVVIHDRSLTRTTDGKGEIDRLSLKEVRSYSAGKWFSKKFESEKVPTLREVFATVGKKTRLRLEIKQAGIEKNLLSVIEQHNLINHVVCSSFNLETLAKIKKMKPLIPVAFICSNFNPTLIGELLRKNINMLDIEYSTLSLPLVKFCHSYGFVVTAWTIDRAREAKTIAGMGVEAICTNFPQLLKTLRAKNCQE